MACAIGCYVQNLTEYIAPAESVDPKNFGAIPDAQQSPAVAVPESHKAFIPMQVGSVIEETITLYPANTSLRQINIDMTDAGMRWYSFGDCAQESITEDQRKQIDNTIQTLLRLKGDDKQR